jgi:hypothetical protein
VVDQSDYQRTPNPAGPTRRCSEREPADSLRDKFNAIGGWLPSLTFALDHMRTSPPIPTFFVLLTFLLGCSAPHRQASSEPPAIVIGQMPDYPVLGHGSDFPGGLVAALWRDGRMIRSTAPATVGRSYVEGVVSPQQREEFFSFVSAAAKRAPKVDAVPIHAATQSITIRSDGHTSKWTRILPDTESVWNEVESRLLSLPLEHRHAVDSGVADNLR